MPVYDEILTEDDFKTNNAYLKPLIAIKLVIGHIPGYVSTEGISQVFPGISQYFPVFPNISQYFAGNCLPWFKWYLWSHGVQVEGSQGTKLCKIFSKSNSRAIKLFYI